MKKILVALVLSAVLLSGCGMFRSKQEWKDAKQENPLEIPPQMDRPSVSDALNIPRVNAQKDTETADTSSNITSLHLDSDVDTAYKRVGLVLGSGDLGSIAGQDAADHSYRLAVQSKLDVNSSQGFLQRHFSNTQPAPGNASAGAGNSGKPPAHMVTVEVSPAAGGGSTVSARGDPQQATRVMSALKARLGG